MIMGWKKYLYFHQNTLQLQTTFDYKTRTVAPSYKVIPLKKHHYKKLQIEKVNQYIKNNLLKGKAIIVISGPIFRKAMTSKLNVSGRHVVQEFKDKGQLKLFNSEFILANIRTENDVDPHLFHKNISVLVQALQLKYNKVNVIDETVGMLWIQEQRSSSLHLRGMWNELKKSENFQYYPISLFMAVMNFKDAFMSIL